MKKVMVLGAVQAIGSLVVAMSRMLLPPHRDDVHAVEALVNSRKGHPLGVMERQDASYI